MVFLGNFWNFFSYYVEHSNASSIIAALENAFTFPEIPPDFLDKKIIPNDTSSYLIRNIKKWKPAEYTEVTTKVLLKLFLFKLYWK